MELDKIRSKHRSDLSASDLSSPIYANAVIPYRVRIPYESLLGVPFNSLVDKIRYLQLTDSGCIALVLDDPVKQSGVIIRAKPSGYAVNTEKVSTAYNIFIGGACDGEGFSILCNPTKWVKNYAEEYTQKHPKSITDYFTWDKNEEIISEIKQKRAKYPEIKINLIGHSYGGDTAIEVAGHKDIKDIPKIDLVITIDPVGGGLTRNDFPNAKKPMEQPSKLSDEEYLKAKLLQKMKAARPNIVQWINVDPQPNEKDNSDKIADKGGKYDLLPKGIVDKFIPLPGYHHYQFNEMMQQGPEEILNSSQKYTLNSNK